MFKLTKSKNYDVSEIVRSEVRIILLYCAQGEPNFLWVVGDTSENMMGLGESFQIGMFGIHFTPKLETILKCVQPRRNCQEVQSEDCHLETHSNWRSVLEGSK